MTEPRTKAGKALLAKLETINASRYATVSFPFADDDILAIEAEAATPSGADLRDSLRRSTAAAHGWGGRDHTAPDWTTCDAPICSNARALTPPSATEPARLFCDECGSYDIRSSIDGAPVNSATEPAGLREALDDALRQLEADGYGFEGSSEWSQGVAAGHKFAATLIRAALDGVPNA